MQHFDYRQPLASHFPQLIQGKSLSTTLYHNHKTIEITAQKLGNAYHIGIEFFSDGKFIGARTLDLKELDRLHQKQEQQND